MTHALDGVVVQLGLQCPYLYYVAGFEGLTQGAAHELAGVPVVFGSRGLALGVVPQGLR